MPFSFSYAKRYSYVNSQTCILSFFTLTFSESNSNNSQTPSNIDQTTRWLVY